MKDQILPRLGTFLILVGLLFLIIFIGSILGREINLKYLVLASASIFLGYIFMRTRKAAEPGRFSTIRKINQAARSKRDEKLARDEIDDKTGTAFPGDR